MARKSFFWWVPEDTWSDPGGVVNVGSDTVALLVDTAPGSGSTPQQDNFVVERIIGQWHIESPTGLSDNVFYHMRVYPTITGDAGISLRDLTNRAEADSDMLWHHTGLWTAEQGTSVGGSWVSGGAGTGFNVQSAFQNGRHGHLDIKVARRVNEGEALIMHLQSTQGVPPGDGTVQLRMWVRILLREG